MSGGKRVTMPCRHVGEVVIGQFAVCGEPGCDGKPRCGKCGSRRVEAFRAEGVPDGTIHCWTCGSVRFEP
jgi:hypothetical protein